MKNLTPMKKLHANFKNLSTTLYESDGAIQVREYSFEKTEADFTREFLLLGLNTSIYFNFYFLEQKKEVISEYKQKEVLSEEQHVEVKILDLRGEDDPIFVSKALSVDELRLFLKNINKKVGKLDKSHNQDVLDVFIQELPNENIENVEEFERIFEYETVEPGSAFIYQNEYIQNIESKFQDDIETLQVYKDTMTEKIKYEELIKEARALQKTFYKKMEDKQAELKINEQKKEIEIAKKKSDLLYQNVIDLTKRLNKGFGLSNDYILKLVRKSLFL